MPVLLGLGALYQRDLFLVYFPLVHSILRAVSEGALPLRDLTSGFGQPLLGDPSCQILYPPAWLHLLMEPPLAYGWFVSLHSVFGGLGIAFLARRMSGGSHVAGMVGGMMWLISGPLQSLATLWHHLSGAAWIPWILLAVESFIERRDRTSAVHIGAALGVQILAGSAEMCAATIFISLLRLMTGIPIQHWKNLLTLSLSLGLALSLGLGAWLPAGQAALGSGREVLNETTRTFWSLHPASLLEFFLPVPLVFLPISSQWKALLFEGREPFLPSMFFGALTLPLVVAALCNSRMSRGVRTAYGAGALAYFLIALGKNAPFYKALVAVVPPLLIFRFPIKAMIPAAMLICVLTGAGAQAVRTSRGARLAAIILAVLLALISLSFMGPGRVLLEETLLAGAGTVDLAAFNRNLVPDLCFTIALLGLLVAFAIRPTSRVLLVVLLFGAARQSVYLLADLNPLVSPDALRYRPAHLEALRSADHGRLMMYDYSLVQGASQKRLGRENLSWTGLEGMSPDVGTVLGTLEYAAPLTGGVWGLEYAWDADLRRLFNRRLARLTNQLRTLEDRPGYLKVLQISGVEKVGALHDAGFEELTLLSRHRIFHQEPLRIFGVPEPLPLAHLTTGRKQSTAADLEDLLDPGFDPRTTVLVDVGPSKDATPGFSGLARVVERRADKVVVETSASTPAFLTLLEGALPGWRAWMDGRATPVERANAAFIGAEVPAGNHRIEFRFIPMAAVVGSISTALTALSLLVWLVRSRASVLPGHRSHWRRYGARTSSGAQAISEPRALNSVHHNET